MLQALTVVYFHQTSFCKVRVLICPNCVGQDTSAEMLHDEDFLKQVTEKKPMSVREIK